MLRLNGLNWKVDGSGEGVDVTIPAVGNFAHLSKRITGEDLSFENLCVMKFQISDQVIVIT